VNDDTRYRSLCEHLRQTAILESTQATLEWDERTMMPRAAGAYRAEQIGYLAGLIHQRRTAPELGELLERLRESSLAQDPHSAAGCNIHWAWHDYQKQRRLPQRLVEAISKATILGQQAWSQARSNNDFPNFLPHLRTIVELKREQAEALGYEHEPYDALLDQYEPGAKTAEVAEVLSRLRTELVPFVHAITSAKRQAPFEILTRRYPIAAQRAFAIQTTKQMGFDYERGRLDETDHPFCTSLGPHDCRILTRYDEHYFSSAFFGSLHEAGHGMYDQGLPADDFGLPSGSYVSLGIHESQSRLWENSVGRSRPFWKWLYPQAQTAFPAALADVCLDDFHFAVNHVSPSLIRVEADEVTYNLHIVIRFELERELIRGNLQAADLPQAWNDAYEANLGIRPENDAEGVLQDIHWSAGLIGYFPTYTLGNLYAAQFLQTAQHELGDWNGALERGEFSPLLEWLRAQIHRHGRRYRAGELVQRISGRPLESQPLMESLHERFDPLYRL